MCWVEYLLGQIAQVRACVLKRQIWHIQAVWAVSKVHHKFIPHTFPLLLWQTLPKCSPNTVPERAVALKLFFFFQGKKTTLLFQCCFNKHCECFMPLLIIVSHIVPNVSKHISLAAYLYTLYSECVFIHHFLKCITFFAPDTSCFEFTTDFLLHYRKHNTVIICYFK